MPVHNVSASAVTHSFAQWHLPGQLHWRPAHTPTSARPHKHAPSPSDRRITSTRRATHRAAAAQQEQQQSQQPAAAQQAPVFDPDLEPQQLLAALSNTSSYAQLAAFVNNQAAVFLHSPLCVYALLHAVQLRDTISDEALGKGSLASEEAVLQQMALVEDLLEQLCDAAEQQVAALPLPTQATLALALAQMDYYHAPLYSAIAQAVITDLAPKQQPNHQQATGSSTSSSSSSQALPAGADVGAAGRAAVLCELPDALVPGVVLSLAVAYSLNGHHDPALLDTLAEQAVAFRGSFRDASPLISISAALMDLQHHAPALLAAAADAVLEQQQQQQQGEGEQQSDEDSEDGGASSGAGLSPDEVVSLLLSLGFFRVEAGQFVELALQEFADAIESLVELEPLLLSRLWKALLLLRGQGVQPPAALMEVFTAVSVSQPDLLLLGAVRAAVDLEQLSAVQGADPLIRQQWEDAGLLAPVQILAAIQDMGYQLERRVEVPVAGFRAGGGQQQQQQEGAEEGQQAMCAVVDVCFRLPDGRRMAVLVLDESRYCNFPPNRLRGGAAVDVLVLQALGLAVLPLPVAEWQALGGEAAQQQRYLKARLAAATG